MTSLKQSIIAHLDELYLVGDTYYYGILAQLTTDTRSSSNIGALIRDEEGFVGSLSAQEDFRTATIQINHRAERVYTTFTPERVIVKVQPYDTLPDDFDSGERFADDKDWITPTPANVHFLGDFSETLENLRTCYELLRKTSYTTLRDEVARVDPSRKVNNGNLTVTNLGLR